MTPLNDPLSEHPKADGGRGDSKTSSCGLWSSGPHFSEELDCGRLGKAR